MNDLSKDITVQYLNKTFFQFDKIFNPDVIQKEVYQITSSKILEEFFKGKSGLIMAYG